MPAVGSTDQGRHGVAADQGGWLFAGSVLRKVATPIRLS